MTFVRTRSYAADCYTGGCAQFWDDVTYRPFSFKRVFLSDPDPMLVLYKSDNPNDRARAMRQLQEPKQHGGTDEDQKRVLDILSTAATSETHAYSRLCAIAALSHFKDPRAVEILQAAYFAGGNLEIHPGIDPERRREQRHEIECAALKALGDTNNPAAIEVLRVAMKEPPIDEREDEFVKMRSRQLRLTAARSLGHFNDKRATERLLQVLRDEKDVAMLDGANEALCQATGKSYPADYKVWDEYLNHPDHTPPKEEGFSAIKLANWIWR